MKIGILTSSRADFGIYLPLLKKLKSDSFFELEIIAFGTHLSKKYGYTINQIEEENFNTIHHIETVPDNDSPMDIGKAIGNTISLFSKFWNKNSYNIVFAIGDRYEMFAAVTATVPFNIKIAHIHGGETTLGAIDNVFRDSITLMSTLHFTSTEVYKKRVCQILGKRDGIYNVGALSIDNLSELKLLSISEFREKFNIDLSIPTILFTFHPETVGYEKNKDYINEIIATLSELTNYQIVITMPNADTMGLMIRERIEEFAANKKNIILIESFGTLGYLTCMKYCSFMLGNTSSGFVEASFFPKYVINLGNRQKGRIITPNIFSIPIIKEKILATVKKIEKLPPQERINIYGNGNAASNIITILKMEMNENI
ncbi:MAG: UDP-N-acetylglucosamine 2-epimerase [Marinilabiliales bacterium]